MILMRCDDQLGGHNVYRDEPAIEERHDVLCISPSATNSRGWGIFGDDRRLIPAAGFYRGHHNRYLAMQDEVTNVDPLSITVYAPDDIYFFGGKIHPHYGHFLLSSLSRFWPYIKDKRPACKILMHEETPPAHWFSFPHIDFCFRRLGLTPDDFVVFSEPTKIKRLIIAAPCFEEEHYAHTIFAEMCNKIGKYTTVEPNEIDRNKSVPVYLSKAKLNSGVWRFSNESEVTDILQQHGIQIVYPEQLSLFEQIELFVQRKWIVSSMASCLHTSIFSWTKPNLIGINYNAKVVTNYTMSDEVNGLNSQYLYPIDGVTDLGPSTYFTQNYKLRDPRKIAVKILELIDHGSSKTSSAHVKFDYPIGSTIRSPASSNKALQFGENISRGKIATQSSICQWSASQTHELDASGAINGVINGRQGFHTDVEDAPWWIVDLGEIFSIFQIKIFNRMDIPGVAERSSRLTIEIGTRGDNIREIYRREELDPFGGIDGKPLIFEPLLPFFGRYVRIRLLARHYMHFDQVEIYGEPKPFFIPEHLL